MATYHAVGSAIRNGIGTDPHQIPADCGGRLRIFIDFFEVGSANVPVSAVDSANPLVMGHEFFPKGARIAGGFLAHDDMSGQSSGNLLIKVGPVANVASGEGELEMYTHRTHLTDHVSGNNVHVLIPWVADGANPHMTRLAADATCWMRPNVTGIFNVDEASMMMGIMFVVD